MADEFKLPPFKSFNLTINGNKLFLKLPIPAGIPNQEVLDAYVGVEFKEVLLIVCRKKFGPGRIVHVKDSEYIWVQPNSLPTAEWK